MATIPTPPIPVRQAAPTAGNRLATAAPRSPVCGSYPVTEKVERNLPGVSIMLSEFCVANKKGPVFGRRFGYLSFELWSSLQTQKLESASIAA